MKRHLDQGSEAGPGSGSVGAVLVSMCMASMNGAGMVQSEVEIGYNSRRCPQIDFIIFRRLQQIFCVLPWSVCHFIYFFFALV